MPTLRPGCHVVPRWRARILPATTISPPAFFKQRRRPAESRPLREDPPAFLCAMVASQILSVTYTDSVKESSHFFLLFAAGFFAAFALVLALAGLASPSGAASA